MIAIRPLTGFAAIVTIGMVAGCATTGWRAQEIDGSSQPAFERSVGSLQERLSPRRRADFEAALAIIWIRSTSGAAADANSDGSVDVAEIGALRQLADDVLTDVRRGVFGPTIARDSGAADYLEQLDGLRYDEVIDLASATSGAVFLAAVRQQRVAAQCSPVRRVPGSNNDLVSQRIESGLMSRRCARH